MNNDIFIKTTKRSADSSQELSTKKYKLVSDSINSSHINQKFIDLHKSLLNSDYLPSGGDWLKQVGGAETSDQIPKNVNDSSISETLNITTDVCPSQTPQSEGESEEDVSDISSITNSSGEYSEYYTD